MADKVNILPNLRIDIPDFEGATQEFTDADSKERFQAIFQDRYAHVPEGFRIEVPDQGSFPGQVNVHNGLGFDRSGKLITSGAAPDTQRSIALTGTTIYYLEVEFTEEASFVDARAFWDPNFDNGTDPSGDVRPSGREFDQNVATRKVPEWQIVSPVSTTGFEINSTPSSNKIPLAVIHVSAGVVVDGGGPANIPLRTSLKESYLAGASAIKVLNSRSMPQVFTCTIGAESVSITANDQDNGILTIGGVTVSAHVVGEQVSVTGGAVYIQQRPEPKPPTAPGAGGTEDARPRLYSGDEEIGHAILQNADAGTGQSDVQIDNLKNYVDFLAGQIRQMKVGAARVDEIGQVAPPFTFSADFRYFEDAGGILGARSNTVSVGDGVSTWGDYNSLQSGSPDLAIQGAIDAVPAGGIVYIKSGTYVLTTAISVTKPIRFVGDVTTIIDASAAPEAFVINTPDAVGFQDITLTASGTAPYAMVVTQCGPKSKFENCAIAGITSVDCDQSRFVGCSFTTPGSGDDAINGIFTDCVFDQCSADCSIAAAAARAVNLIAGSSENTFRDCLLFTSNATPTSVVEVLSRVLFDSCRIPVPQDGEGVLIAGPDVSIRDCDFTQATSSAGTTGRGVKVTSATGDAHRTSVKGSRFTDCDIAIEFEATVGTQVSFTDNNVTCPTASRGRFGVYFTGACVLTHIMIAKNVIESLNDDSGATTYVGAVVAPDTATAQLAMIHIVDNNFFKLGIVAATNLVSAYGVLINTGNVTTDASIARNTCREIRSDQESAGIWIGLSDNIRARICENSMRQIGDSLGDTPASQGYRGIYVGSWDNLVVSDNILNALGSVSATAAAGGQAIRLGDTLVGNPNGNATVSGNVIDNLRHGAGTQHGILITNNASNMAVNNNHIGTFSGAASSVGIRLFAAAGAGEAMENVSISGNVIRNIDEGISINLAGGAGGDLWENYVIANNVIEKFVDWGIVVIGDNVNIPISISGNSLVSLGLATAIQVEDAGVVSVNGNSIWMNGPGGGSVRGIVLDNCNTVAVVGNTMRLITGAFADVGVDLIACAQFSITGNTIQLNTTHVAGKGIDVSTSTSGTICGNNLFQASGGGFGTSVFLGVGGLYLMMTGNNCRGWIGGALAPSAPNLTAHPLVTDQAMTYTVGVPDAAPTNHYYNLYT